MVKDDAILVLDSHRTMAIATLRPDGWPQNTIVGYANLGLTVYFLIFRNSQKFDNIQRDDRVALAIGEQPRDLRELNAVYAGAHATEVTDPGEQQDAWRLLTERHPNLAGFGLPDATQAAMMRAKCEFVSLLDYRAGPGHGRSFTVAADGSVQAAEAKRDDWGKHAIQGEP